MYTHFGRAWSLSEGCMTPHTSRQCPVLLIVPLGRAPNVQSQPPTAQLAVYELCLFNTAQGPARCPCADITRAGSGVPTCWSLRGCGPARHTPPSPAHWQPHSPHEGGEACPHIPPSSDTPPLVLHTHTLSGSETPLMAARCSMFGGSLPYADS